MVSLDPDDFLADIADLPAHPHPSFPDKQAEEEELEWLSNKDSFPSVEMCILPLDPPAPPKSLGNVEQAKEAIPLPEMPSVETKDDGNGKTKFKRVCTFCGVVQTLQRVLGVCNVCGFSYKSGRTSCPGEESPKEHSIEGEKVKRLKGVCTHCGVTHSPQWRVGPQGKKTLCNACGLRYISGRLYPEYRPANSPMFSQELHSNKHKRILEKRNQILEIKGSVVNPVDKCTNSEATVSVGKMKKNTFPIVATGKIVEQISRSLIVEEQSPFSVLENNTNGSATPVPHQPPNNALKQQHLFTDQLNDKNSHEDTAKVKTAINSTILMSSDETVKMSYKVPSDALEQQLFSCEPTNKRRKRNTVELKNEKHIATQMSRCEKLEQPRQLTSEFLEYHQPFNDQPINNCSNKLTAKEEKTLKAVEISGTNTVALGNSKLCIDTSNIREQPLVTAIFEQHTPASVFKSSINSSMALVNSSKPINHVNQALSESLVQYNQLCDPPKHKPKEIDVPTVETERTSSTLMRSSVTLELTNLAPNELLEQQQQQQICNQAYNNANKKDTVRLRTEGNNTTVMSHGENFEPLHQARMGFLGQEQVFRNKANNETSKEDTVKVESEGKCQDCGDEQSPRWVGVPLGRKTLCNSCGPARCAALQQKGIALEVGEKPYTLSTGKSTNLTCTLPIQDEFYFTLKPSDTANTEHQNHSSGLETRRYNSMDLMSSCRVKFPHRVRSKGLYRKRSTIPRQQVQVGANCMNCSKQTNRWRMGPHGPTTLCNVCGNSYQPMRGINSVTENIAKVCQHCESEEATEWLTCPVGPKAVCSSCYHWFKYFCNQTNNISDRKARTEVDTGRKCHNCGAKATPLWRSGPMGAKTLCNACGIRWHKFGDLCRQPLK